MSNLSQAQSEKYFQTREPWECMIDATMEGRRLTDDEIDSLDEPMLKVALRRRLITDAQCQKALYRIWDAQRETSWYDR